ncbi:MAG: endonuclease III [Clostridiales Family XIII bacterium]|jgi:endonuclease-3|nr:endonuclease III [Clostridiales Family XIII bacterium]
MKILSKKDCAAVLDLLRAAYPKAGCALEHRNVFELLVKVVLSAQTTDKSVNAVSGELFGLCPDAASLAAADEEELRRILRPIGMYRTKARNIKALAARLASAHDGAVPADYDALIALPGVGRKTANVVLAVGFGLQRIAVDTHVFRVANRIGLCDEKDVLQTELALMRKLPGDRLTEAHHSLIFHGRGCCGARRPACEACPVLGYCRYAHALHGPGESAVQGRRTE